MSRLLDRLPPLASTGVGSLPFPDPEAAAAHAVTAYEIPFCPQLPRLEGDMIEEWLGADPGRCGWSPDRDRERPMAWRAFIAELERRRPAHRVVKLQVTGPVTLAVALEQAAGRSGRDAATRRLAVEIAIWLAASASAQSETLAGLGLDCLLMIDEPGLAGAGLGVDDVSVWSPLARSAAAWGLHVCGPVPWALIDAGAPDAVSFDVARYGLNDAGRRSVTALVRRGGRVIWGAVDPAAPGNSAAAAARIANACASLGTERPLTGWLAGSLISPSCGTGLTSVLNESRVSAVIASAAEALKGASVIVDAPRQSRLTASRHP